jgi:hypothetical protein
MNSFKRGVERSDQNNPVSCFGAVTEGFCEAVQRRNRNASQNSRTTPIKLARRELAHSRREQKYSPKAKLPEVKFKNDSPQVHQSKKAPKDFLALMNSFESDLINSRKYERSLFYSSIIF